MLIKSKKLAIIKTPHKAGQLEVSDAGRASQLEIQAAKKQAQAIKQEAENTLIESRKKLSDAETKANEIIKAANLEAERIKKKVYEETLQAANLEVEEIKNQSKQLLSELFEVKRQALTQAHEEIIKVALDLAEKIIKYQASIDPNVLKTQVVESIKRATSEADRVQVFVNPLDLKTLEASIPELLKLFPSGIDIVSLPNDSVDQGSCIVETKSGQLDANFSTQLIALINLVSNLEVQEPQIESFEQENIIEAQNIEASDAISIPVREEDLLIQEEEPLGEEFFQDTSQKELQTTNLTLEEEALKEELLGEESLVNLIEQEDKIVEEVQEETQQIEQTIEVPEIIETTEEQEIQEEVKQEILEIPESISEDISENIETIEAVPLEEPSPELPKKKKLTFENLLERTEEEIEELDYEEEDFDSAQDEDNEKQETNIKNILKPKNPSPTGISSIASQLEKDPEWKDLLQDEGDE